MIGLVKRRAELAGEIERFVADMPQGRREFEAVARHRLKARSVVYDRVELSGGWIAPLKPAQLSPGRQTPHTGAFFRFAGAGTVGPHAEL